MAFDLERYVFESFPRINKSGDERAVDCIWCGKRGKLYINVKKYRFFCFRCGAGKGARIVDFLRDHRGISEAEAWEILQNGRWAQYSTTSYEEHYEQQIRQPRATVLPEEYEAIYPVGDLDDYVLGMRAVKYLRERGLTDADFLMYRIGFCAGGRYARRIIIPVVRKKEIVYFMARLFMGAGKRYMNPAGDEVVENSSRLLFNWDQAKMAKTLKITEGVFDAIALGDEATSLFGKQVHDAQHRLLETGKFEAIEVWLDPDAIDDAQEIAHDLRDYQVPITICRLSHGDPGDLRREDIPVTRIEATGWADHFRRRFHLEASNEQAGSNPRETTGRDRGDGPSLRASELGRPRP